MKIKLISDVHLEFYKEANSFNVFDRICTPADVLVVAGDLHVGRNNVADALNHLSKMYKHVIYTPGNHEFYHSRIDELNGIVDLLAPNVAYCNPGVVRLDDVTFIVAPLWTNFRSDPLAALAAQAMISDFGLIKDFDTTDCSNLYYKHEQYIKFHYANVPGKKVIVTHFLPAIECVAKRYQSYDNLLNKYFANSLDNWILGLSNVPYWFFGHTHDHIDVTIGETRMIANPFGYPTERNYTTKDVYEV
jgi:predicted phosphodiesterase